MQSILLTLFLMIINLTSGHTSQHSSELLENVGNITRSTQQHSFRPTSSGTTIQDYLPDELLIYILSFNSTKWTDYCIISSVNKSFHKAAKKTFSSLLDFQSFYKSEKRAFQERILLDLQPPLSEYIDSLSSLRSQWKKVLSVSNADASNLFTAIFKEFSLKTSFDINQAMSSHQLSIAAGNQFLFNTDLIEDFYKSLTKNKTKLLSYWHPLALLRVLSESLDKEEKLIFNNLSKLDYDREKQSPLVLLDSTSSLFSYHVERLQAHEEDFNEHYTLACGLLERDTSELEELLIYIKLLWTAGYFQGNNKFKQATSYYSLVFDRYLDDHSDAGHIHYFEAAKCYAQLGQYDEALSCNLKYLKRAGHSANPEVYATVAYLYQTLNNHSEALNYYELAKKRNLDHDRHVEIKYASLQ